MPETIEETQEDIQLDERVDEFAREMFAYLGYQGRLPDTLVEVYNNFKRVKDRLRPGRLTPGEFAMVVTLHGMVG